MTTGPHVLEGDIMATNSIPADVQTLIEERVDAALSNSRIRFELIARGYTLEYAREYLVARAQRSILSA